METVRLSRRIEAAPEDVESLVRDVGPFMRAAGFDEVGVDGDSFTIENGVGLVSIQLELDIVEPDAEDVVLAYEQREGIFDEMWTTYAVRQDDGATEVTAETEFALKGGPVGSVLDATVIKRQRRSELQKQLDYLETTAE